MLSYTIDDARAAMVSLIDGLAADRATRAEMERMIRCRLRILDGYITLFPDLRTELPPEVLSEIESLSAPKRRSRPRAQP